MALEEIEPKVFKAKYHIIKDKDLVSLMLPREIAKHLELTEAGELGFKKIRYKGKKYALLAELISDI